MVKTATFEALLDDAKPVGVYPTDRLAPEGLAKPAEAREIGTAEFPEWLKGDMTDAKADPGKSALNRSTNPYKISSVTSSNRAIHKQF